MNLNIGVTDLAEFVHRIGDIDDRDNPWTLAREGISTQKKYQARRSRENDTYESECSISYTYSKNEITLNVLGRIDGVYVETDLHGGIEVVEEIKTTRIPLKELTLATSSVNEAQVKLYAGMRVKENQLDAIATQLTYIHPDTERHQSTFQEWKAEDLVKLLDDSCKEYLDWIQLVVDRVKQRNELSKEQTFPFEKYNEDQQRLARFGYMNLRDQGNLLFEAPTGSGKSMTAAFPSMKTFGEEQLDRVVFATARTTGQQAANDAFSKLREQNEEAVITTVSAKERVCLTPGAACRPEECVYAKGHYDRIRKATANLLLRRNVNRNAIETIARSFKVCPFELSLDAAEWSDVVICDYNYIFDPFVQLKRIHSQLFNRVGLLVDEAHRLTDRVRESLSFAFDQSILEYQPSQSLPEPLSEKLNRILALLQGLLDTHVGEAGEAMQASIDTPLKKEIEGLIKIFELPEHSGKVHHEDQEFFIQFYRFLTIWSIREDVPEKFAWYFKRDEYSSEVSLRCLIADHWIRSSFDRFHGSIRFSGTLSPGNLYNQEHGLDGACLKAKITAKRDRLGVYVVPDLSTYYQDRERTAPDLAILLEQIRSDFDGNWLVAFPSFKYMSLVLEHVVSDDSILVQRTNLTLEEREEFINSLAVQRQQLGFVVMGGVFTESVDFEYSALEGVIVISPGIPPKSLELDMIQEQSDNGYEIAYRKPAMVRVVQAAGRVLRNEEDRGLVVLIDNRFTRSEYAQYFPSHWQPEVTRVEDVVEALAEFRNRQVLN